MLKNGTKWKKVRVGEQSTGRLAIHNILKECSGPLSYARRNTQATSPASAWLLFIDKFIQSTSDVRDPDIRNFRL